MKKTIKISTIITIQICLINYHVCTLLKINKKVCGKCGGDIEACGSSDPRLHELSGKIPDDKPIFMCVLCNQPYWWNENENSRSSRALSLADRLFTSIQTGIGQPVTSVKRDLSGNVSKDTTTTSSATTTSTTSTATAAAGDMSDSKHEECAGITTSILNSYQNLSDIAGYNKIILKIVMDYFNYHFLSLLICINIHRTRINKQIC